MEAMGIPMAARGSDISGMVLAMLTASVRMRLSKPPTSCTALLPCAQERIHSILNFAVPVVVTFIYPMNTLLKLLRVMAEESASLEYVAHKDTTGVYPCLRSSSPPDLAVNGDTQHTVALKLP